MARRQGWDLNGYVQWTYPALGLKNMFLRWLLAIFKFKSRSQVKSPSLSAFILTCTYTSVILKLVSEHPIAKKITDLLAVHNCWFETFEHEQVRTSEEAARLRPDYTLDQGAKAIILRVKVSGVGKKFVMLVMPGSQKFDSSKVKQLLHSNDIRFATEEEVDAVTDGVKPGGVPPFGNLFNIEVVCDSKLLEADKIIFNAGRNYSIGMKSQDYIMLVKPTTADIGA